MENHILILNKLPIWLGRKIKIKKLNGGITNINYLVIFNKEKYVARFASKSNILLGINRNNEIYNTKIGYSLNIAPEIIRFFPQYNLLVVRYIDGKVFNPKMAKSPKQIKLLAKLFKKLHNGPKFKDSFDPFKTIKEYIKTAKKHKTWMPADIDELQKELNDVKIKIGKFDKNCPCHLDLVIKNIISTKDGVKLIDWEYSKNSDYRFDLAMLSVNGKYSLEQDKLLLKEYGNYSQDLYKQIQMIKAVICFREATWSLVQLSISKVKFDYRKYAILQFKLFKSYANKINEI